MSRDYLSLISCSEAFEGSHSIQRKKRLCYTILDGTISVTLFYLRLFMKFSKRVNVSLSESDYDLLSDLSDLVGMSRASVLFNLSVPTIRELSPAVSALSRVSPEVKTMRRLRQNECFASIISELNDVSQALSDSHD